MLRPRFSLKSLLIAVVLLGFLFGGAALWYRTQKAALQQQLELGNQLQLEGATLEWERWVPAWLYWLGDSKSFRQISGVHLWQPETISDEQWQWSAGLKTVSLAVTADMLTDEMVTRLSSLKPLKELMLLPPLPGGRDIDDAYYHFKLQSEISGKLPGVNVVLGQTWHHTPLRGDTQAPPTPRRRSRSTP
jgi:hypothetical protein